MMKLNKRKSEKKSVFKMSQKLSKSMRMLFGSESEPSYNTRLRLSAMRIVQGDANPFACSDCGETGLEDILELHHDLDDSSTVSGNHLRKTLHGTGASEYRYIIQNGPNNNGFRWVLVCPNCHANRHKRAIISC